MFMLLLACVLSFAVFGIVTYKLIGRSSLALIFGMLILFVASPLTSYLIYDGFNYDSTFTLMIVFFATFAAAGMLVMLSFKINPSKSMEASFSLNWQAIHFLTIALVLSLFGTFMMYRLVFSVFSISNLNDLNIAFSSNLLPSLGIYGRLNRLAIPLGLLCLVLSRNTRDKKMRSILLIYCAIFTSMLIGVRRSTIIVQISLYVTFYLLTVNDIRSMIKSLLITCAAVFSSAWFFGLIQIATNKSAYENPIFSGLIDGLKYFSGNIAYAECISVGKYPYPSGNSLPFFYQLLNIREAGEIYKPFCNIAVGELFNTSPVYFDLYNDGGWVMLIIFSISVSILIFMTYLNKINIIGMKVILTAAIVFFTRENIIGQYDTVYSIVVYILFLYIIRRISARRS